VTVCAFCHSTPCRATCPRRGGGHPSLQLVERDWDALVFNSKKGVASTLGWRSYHVLRSKGSVAGFPDRVCFRDRVVYVELKTMVGKPSGAQVEWLTGLARAGAEVYLWRPADLDEAASVLAGRYRLEESRLVRGVSDEGWTPGSLWLPAGHRADEAPGVEKAA
jgi:hypothetical protein